jgi:hypothetical protein
MTYGGADPPEEFCCPISYEVMTDPVIMPDCRTYERSVITEALCRRGFSPFTNRAMAIGDARSNLALKNLIERWRKGDTDMLPARASAETPRPPPLHPSRPASPQFHLPTPPRTPVLADSPLPPSRPASPQFHLPRPRTPVLADPPNFADLVAEVASFVGPAYSIAAIEAALRSDNYDKDQACNFLFANRHDPIRVALPDDGGPPIPPDHLQRLQELLPHGMTIKEMVQLYRLCNSNIDNTLSCVFV